MWYTLISAEGKIHGTWGIQGTTWDKYLMFASLACVTGCQYNIILAPFVDIFIHWYFKMILFQTWPVSVTVPKCWQVHVLLQGYEWCSIPVAVEMPHMKAQLLLYFGSAVNVGSF